ncbi:MAG: lytic murein transglycosylase B [Gammaproteobacteria bacterium]
MRTHDPRSEPFPARAPALAALCAALLAGCVSQAPPPPAPGPAAPSAPAPQPPPAPRPPAQPTSDVADLATMRAAFVRDTQARYGVPAERIERVLDAATMREGIVAAMSRPAERKAWHEYRPIFISDARIAGGRDFLARHRASLSRVEARYGVPAEVIVAIIGVETSYGGNMGSHGVVDALYTLAFAYPRSGDPTQAERERRRELFFRDELAQLFKLADEQGLDMLSLKGSYAGAMGYGQFMPSSWRDYAVDGDGDGRIDLFGNLEDVFASVANYFVEKGGWRRGGPVMVRAQRDPGAADFNAADTDDPFLSQAELAARGWRAATAVPPDAPATVIRLEGADGPEHWMIFDNFRAITRYNNSRLYATAVWQLAQAIAGRPPA